MTLRRATLYIAGATLLAAWFSSAASLTLGRYARRPSPASERDPAAQSQALAIDVQAQSRRLAQRLAAAPAPQQPVRNPFAFKAQPVAREAAAARPAPEPEPAPLAAPVMVEPALTLIGLAEDKKGDAVVRSAVISDGGADLIIAEVGAVLLGRYTITAIEGHAVEMKDGATGLLRRLVLQNQ